MILLIKMGPTLRLLNRLYMKNTEQKTTKPLTLIRNILLSCSIPVLVACESTPPPELDSSLIPESQRKVYQASLSKAKACPINLAQLVDERTSKDLLVGNDNVSQDTVYAMLKQSLHSMNVSPDINSNNRVKVSLERAFIKSLGSNITATVVINVQYKPHYSDTYSPSVSYKGQSVIVNADTKEDLQSQMANGVVEEAIVKATQRIKSSLLHQCEDPTDGLDIT